MKSYVCYLFILGMLLFGSSCATVGSHYRAKSVHLLTVDEKGDVAISGGANTRIKIHGEIEEERSKLSYHHLHFQAAYSPIQNFALSTSTDFLLPKNKEDNQIEGYDIDVALGIYKSYAKNTTETENLQPYLLDAYLSYGLGQMMIVNQADVTGWQLKYNRYGIQLGGHYKISGWADKVFLIQSIIYKPSFMVFNNLSIIGDLSNSDIRFRDYLQNKNTYFAHEFSFNNRIGTEAFQVSINFNVVRASGDGRIQNMMRNDSFVLGLLINLNQFKREKNKDF